MRTNLKIFRVKQQMSQEEFAKKIGYSRPAYACIEKGLRDGRLKFWEKLQKAFDLPETEIYHLMIND